MTPKAAKPDKGTAPQDDVLTTLPAAMTGRASPAKAAVGDKPVFAYIGSLPQPQRSIAERVDSFGDAALRLRQAGDVGKYRFVTDRRLRGACPARHGFWQRCGDASWCRRARGRFLPVGLVVAV